MSWDWHIITSLYAGNNNIDNVIHKYLKPKELGILEECLCCINNI